MKILVGQEGNYFGRGRFSSADSCHGSHIRIYNVDKGWKVKKDILAKSLRWTITDACLLPNQHYLVYASLSPVVHIVMGRGVYKAGGGYSLGKKINHNLQIQQLIV
ncbi:hypothetical protein NC651_021252 [Populus alba x Populus x berolinensis]|nr:hypothetical protein NC651_021252 [Populus alba x Populus x berolinensis]